ncbi:unnamed protein product [Soboliphyme baturini]|uniref:Alpha-catulin n=1 Tax=Soboliphyme baturini TaxID=241478 RepID=A0A183IIQ3_9BILA|nr:unnamed protein product [Soboliphyme baturini]
MKLKSDKIVKAVKKVGFFVQAAVERFVTVGESIADEHPEIQPEMYDACQDARVAGTVVIFSGSAIAALASKSSGEPAANGSSMVDRNFLVRAARQLLSSVTRVLLLADRVVVKQILKCEEKLSYSLTHLENISNFPEFVKVFTTFGGEMVTLAHKTGDRQQDLKSEKRRAQMQVARTVLEKYTMLLLTSSKTLLRHPECDSAQQTRNGVFRQIRFSLQLIALCVSDGVVPYDPCCFCMNSEYNDEEPLDLGLQLTATVAIKQLLDSLEMIRMTGNIGVGIKERLCSSVDAVSEMIQDFTDSAYTSHHHREQIIDFIGEIRSSLTSMLRLDAESDKLHAEDIDVSVHKLSKVIKDLQKQLQLVALDQTTDVFKANEDHIILSSIKSFAVSGDIDGLEDFIERFREHAEHVEEVARLLHHISLTDSLHIHTGHAERNLRALSPLMVLAGRTLCLHPSSRIARENLEVFCDTWAHAVNELSRVAKETDSVCHGQIAAEKQAYMSLPKPGVDAEAEKWDEYAENDIVKRAKSMSSMAYNMYLFTRGDGPLKTTHDLFTQAEFFAEEANKMYKTVREFSYEVPGSAEKNELIQVLERIPGHCQQLQVLVKTPTVGKSATFNKVDSVIQETKDLMNEIAKLVTSCFVCATKVRHCLILCFLISSFIRFPIGKVIGDFVVLRSEKTV